MNDEEKISNLYQQGKDKDPSVHLDDAILKMARDAVQADTQSATDKIKQKDKKIKSPFSGGWPVTASIAAVLIITVILVPLLKQEATLSSPTPMQLMEQDMAKIIDIEMEHATLEVVGKTAKKRSPVPSADQQLMRSHNSGLKAMQSNALNGAALRSSPSIVADESAASMSSVTTVKEKTKLSLQKHVATSTTEIDNETLKESEMPNLPATQWMQKIKQLLKRGDIKQAREELTEFNKHYPDEKIDISILQQLEQ